VVEVIRDVQPQVVITFNKYGGYGHPDHIAIQRATTDAFARAGDATYITDGQQPYAPQKLYYSSVPKTILQFGIFMTRMRGDDPRRLGANNDIDLVAILDHIEPIHTRIDVSQWYDAWDAASACHASQLGARSQTIPTWLRRQLSPWQGLTRIYPAPNGGRGYETDLFVGVTLDERRGVTA
jgi:LmbE family N-acetylglucosaminyl deacetylase